MARKPATQTMDASPLMKERAAEIHRRLCVVYVCPIPYFHSLDPLSELVSSLLSHRTRNADSGRAFKELRRRYASWQELMDAPTPDVEAAIAAVTWPELKAPRIRQVLRLVQEKLGELSLDFLEHLTVAEATAWLRELPGVGPKTAAAVLSFSTLRKAALPVDSHHHRVAERLGLIRKGTSLEAAHLILAAQLPPTWTAQEVYDNHEILMLHGQKCCYFQKPACERCVLNDICPSSLVPSAREIKNGLFD